MENDRLNLLVTKLFLFLFSVVFNHAYGQHFFFRRYTIEDGLLSSDNYQTIQDKSGYIWICSKNGIVRYDGYRFKAFTTENGLPINDIWELYCDSHNRIWIRAFTKGLYYLENGQVKSVKAAKNQNNLLVSHEYRDTLFFMESTYNSNTGKQRYYLSKNGDFGRYSTLDYNGMYLLGDYRKYNILQYKLKTNESNYWVFKFQNSGKTISQKHGYSIGNVLLPGECNNVYSLELNRYDSLLIISKNTLNTIGSKTHFGGKVTHIKRVAFPYEYIVVVDGKCRYYKNILTKERAFRFENRINQLYKSFGTNWNVFIDKESNLWFTLLRGEIIFVPASTEFVEFHEIHHNGIKEQGIHSLYNYGNRLIVLTTSKKAFYFDKKRKTFQQIRTNDDHYFRLLTNRFTNEAYLLGSKSIVKLPKGNSIQKPQIIYDGQLKSFIKTMVWITVNEVLASNGETFHVKSGKLKPNGKINQLNQKIEEIRLFNGHFMVKTPAGLLICNPKTGTIVKSFENHEINSIYQEGNSLLLGTNGKGLLQLNKSFSLKYLGLKGYVIYDLKAGKQHYYLATNKGLVVLNRWTKQVLRVLTRHDGLASTEINTICLDDEQLYLGTKSGFNSIPLKKVIHGTKMVSVLKQEAVYINEVPRNSSGNDVFSYNENNLRYQFESLSFSTLGLSRFKYKLCGHDHQWKYSNVHTIVYNNLSHGNYKLVVYALNKESEIISKPLEYDFVVKPHFFQTVGARILFSLLALMLIDYIVYLVSAYSNKQMQRKQHLSQLELRALRAQLNPHFVFNSLNSLQTILILKGEMEANRHIHAFSGLMRKVLDNSKNETISLSDEMGFLTNYLILEENRMSEKLQFDIQYNGEVDASEIRLPVMLFQPIVENAIVHGLVNKTGVKRINIMFTLQKMDLIAVIEDNGIGRERAEQLTTKQRHKSWSSTILNEKINVFNQMKNDTVKFTIVDLADQNGVPSGTRVIVSLKIDHFSRIS